MKKALLVLCLTVLLGCDKREDFPPTLSVSAPPAPQNLVIKKINTLIGVLDEYELDWEVENNSGVDYFRIYAWAGLVPEYIGDSDAPPDTITTLAMSGLFFGVSTVSDQNVESDPTFALAPDTLWQPSR